MKIHRITVTDENGVDHTWEGVEGHLNIQTVSKMGQPYQQAVNVHLTLAVKPEVKPS